MCSLQYEMELDEVVYCNKTTWTVRTGHEHLPKTAG